jgi:hypothetical protein
VHASLSSSSGIPLETLHRTFCTLTLHSFYHYSCRSVFYPSSSTPSEYQSITRVACTCGNIPYSHRSILAYGTGYMSHGTCYYCVYIFSSMIVHVHARVGSYKSHAHVQVHVHVGIKFDSYPKMYRW